jgi:threonine dehydratase
VKITKIEHYGARVVRAGLEYAAAFAAAQEEMSRTGALYCHAYDQPDIAAGAGTLALELEDQISEPIDIVIVAVGGGLMAGVAAAMEGSVHVVGVEPVGVPTLRTALQHGGPVDIPVNSVAGDSLGARRIGDIAYDLATGTSVTSILVTDDDNIGTRTMLWDQWRLVVEDGAAAALAAITSGAYQPEPDETVAIVLCGSNNHPLQPLNPSHGTTRAETVFQTKDRPDQRRP